MVPVFAATGLPFGRAVVQPEHASIANAYGCGRCAGGGGELDFMFSLATITRSSALAWGEREAQRRAGADPAALRSSRVRLRPDSRYKKGRRRPNHDATSNTAISSCWVSRRLMETQTFTIPSPFAGTDWTS